MATNHQEAFKNYLIDKGFSIKISEGKIEGLKDEVSVVADFDELGRLTKIDGTNLTLS